MYSFISMCMRSHTQQRENDSTLIYIFSIWFIGIFYWTELRGRRTGICLIWSRGRHFSLFVPVREARCLEAVHAQGESDHRVEISGSVVKVQCSDNTVTRYTIYSGYAHAYVHLFHAMRRYKIEESISFPEPTCLLVSAKTRCLGADQKTRGLWERDCRRISLQCK